jgi:hypothetical protein
MAAKAAELVPLSVPEIRKLLWQIVWEHRWEPRLALHWSFWRRRHQAIARACHYKRRGAFP